MFEAFFGKHSLAECLEDTTGCPFPCAADRKAWEGLSPEIREDLLTMAEAYRDKPYPMVTAGQFMAFARTGSRKDHETPYFFRRKKLIAGLLGCCAGKTADDLDRVIDGIWCICEESSWVISAHNGSSHEGMRPAAERPLPDVRNPYVDLFSAQTGMILALTGEMLREELDAVTPLVRRRIAAEIEQRILVPFETRDDFWWMGMIRKDLCNWTPWIVSNVMMITRLQVTDKARKAEILTRGCRMLDRWLDVVPEDGGCDEGTGYWNMAGGALLDCLELLEQVTGGKMTFREDRKLRGILSFPRKARIGNGWFVNFADCDAKPLVSGERLQFAGEMTGDPELTAMGMSLRGRPSRELEDTPQLWRCLNEIFRPLTRDIPEKMPPKDVWLPDLQMRVLERGRLVLAAKGGNNGESHNHNDVGSFMLYADGEPVVVDAGNMTYTAKTFSDRRYEIWNVRAWYHNIPVIGMEQQAGAAYRAENVTATPDGIVMELAKAYPAEAGVKEFERRMELSGEPGRESMTLTDTIRTERPDAVLWNFLLREEPDVRNERLIRIGNVIMEIPEGMNLVWEEIEVGDPRMARNFPGSLWQLSCAEDVPRTERKVTFVFRR